MSAWLCEEEHIYEMAHYFVAKCQQYTSREEKLTIVQVAIELWAANNRSLNARYGAGHVTMKVLSHYHPIVKNPFHMAKLVDCFSYQSCEYDGWEKSRAYKMCESMHYNLLSHNADYEAAPWGFYRDAYERKFCSKNPKA